MEKACSFAASLLFLGIKLGIWGGKSSLRLVPYGTLTTSMLPAMDSRVKVQAPLTTIQWVLRFVTVHIK